MPSRPEPMPSYGLATQPRRPAPEARTEPSSEPKEAPTPTSDSEQPTSDSKGDSDKEDIQKVSGIESAKDRAQITSSTAMSIVHIALLKNVLDFGSEHDNYYSYRIGFILTALLLQVIAGFLALYIALLRGYYTKHRDDFLQDCSKICCPWRCRKNTRKYNRHQAASTDMMDQECEEHVGCCPYKCDTQSYYDFEYEILDMYNVVTENAIRSEIDAASANSEIKWFTTRTESLKTKLENYKNASDEATSAEHLASLNKEITEALKKKEALEMKKQLAETYLAKGIAMEKHVEKIYQQRVLKRVTFWQNLLNMIFYVVFVLNAVIAGIGLASPNPLAAAERTNTTITPQNS